MARHPILARREEGKMSETWSGKRRNRLRLMSGRVRTKDERWEAASLLSGSSVELEKRMGATLARVKARALRSPVYASNRIVWERIAGLDDLATAPYTSSNLLPRKTDQAPDWSNWIIDGEQVIATAATSGSTGSSKLMPFTQQSLDEFARANSPQSSRIIRERGLPPRPVALALTAPEGYASHLSVPYGLAANGNDVLHVPLATLVNDSGVALDFIDWVLAPTNELHIICTVAAMLPTLVAALEEHPGGTDAVGKMGRTLRVLYSGGCELTPTVANMLSAQFGLPPSAWVNQFATTEVGVAACSLEDFSAFHCSLHTHVISIIPLDELEKERRDPSYQPRNVLLTRAPVGLVGELACVFDAAIPWINLRQGDMFEVVEPVAGSDVPRLRHLARMSSVHDIAGGRVWPASYERAMASLGGKVTDYLAIALKPGEVAPSDPERLLVKDRLLFYYEGVASLHEIAGAIFDTIPILVAAGPTLGAGSFDMEILNVKAGALQRCRQRKSQERDGSPGPLKHRVVRGLQYEIPVDDIRESGPGWIPSSRESGISRAAIGVDALPEHAADQGSGGLVGSGSN
jgi:hypothetical protein